MKFKIAYTISFFILMAVQSMAQNKQLENANSLYADKSFVLAIEEYEQILEKDVLPEAMINLAQSYWALRKGEKAEQWFEIAELNGGFTRTNEYYSPELIYTYAEALKFNGKYKAAQEKFLEYESITGDSKGSLQAKICNAIPVLMKDSSKVELKTFEYNSSNAEFAPQLNNEILYYVGSVGKFSESDIDNYTGEPYLDIVMSKYPGTDSSEAPKALNKRINSSFNEGPLTFSRSGDKIIFTRNYFAKGEEQRRSDGFLGFGLFESSQDGIGKWSDPNLLKMGEIEYNFGHPSLTYNGEMMYFVSDMPGGYGGTDIYVSTRLSDGWSTPRNLGPAINTQGNEVYPYIHLTGTLYFASDYHQGLGGLDIFSSRKNEEGEWGNIRNLGYPINSSADDFAIFLKPDSREGYFSSNRPGGQGSDDIYKVFIEVPVDQLMDVDSLISALDSSVLSDTTIAIDTTLAGNEIKEESEIMKVEKDALKNTSGGYFEFMYGDDDQAELSVEEELKLLEEIELDNSNAVEAYFGADESLRTEDDLQEELMVIEENLKNKTEEKPEVEEESKPAVSTIPDERKDDVALPIWEEFLDNQGNLLVNAQSSTFINKKVEGLVFRIQIGAYRIPVYGGAENFFGKKGVESYELQDNITRYLLPNSFETIKEAEAYRKSLSGDKLRGAFIVPFLNAKRINMGEAIQLLNE